jgi:hypothetical protein
MDEAPVDHNTGDPSPQRDLLELLPELLAEFRAGLEALAAERDRGFPGHFWAGEKRQRQRDVQRAAQQLAYNLARAIEPRLALPFRQSLIALNEISKGHKVDWLIPEQRSRPPLSKTIEVTRMKIVAVMDFLHESEKMTMRGAVQFITKELGRDRVMLLVGRSKRRTDTEDAILQWRRMTGRGCTPALRRTYNDIKVLMASQASCPKEAAANVLRVIAMDID